MHQEQERRLHDELGRCEVLDRIEPAIGVNRRRDGEAARHREQRVAVGRRARNGSIRDDAADAGAILDNEGTAQSLAQLLRKQPRLDVVPAAGRLADDHAHRLDRIITCSLRARKIAAPRYSDRRGPSSGVRR